MLRVAVCISDDGEAQHSQALCEACAARGQLGPIDVDRVATAIDLERLMQADKARDLLVCAAELPGMSGFDVLRELRGAGNDVPVIVVARDGSHAFDAFSVQAAGYLVQPVGLDAFAQIAEPILRAKVQQRRAGISVKGRDGAYRVRFDELLYSETRNHDQVLHLHDGTQIVTRCSSGALFGRVQHDPRFFKAGSSYILNLEFVRSLQGCEALLSTGEVLQVPSRVRKPLEAALMAAGV